MAPHPGEVFILVASLYLATASLLGYSFVAPSSGFSWIITHAPHPPSLDQHTLLSASVATPRKCFWWFYFRHYADSLAFTFLTSLIIYIPKPQIFIRMSTSILNSLVQSGDRCLFMSVPFLHVLYLRTLYSVQVSKDGACPSASLPPPLVLKSFPSSSVKLLSLPRLSSLSGLFQQSFPLTPRHTPPSCLSRLLSIRYPVSFL